MTLSSDNIKFYQCTTWAEGDSHGGDIDTENEITSGVEENIFDDVSEAERVSGDTEYRKIFVKNENTDTWGAVKAWIESFTPATNDEISIALGTNAGTQSSEGTGLSYKSPDSKTHEDVLNIGDLAQNEYQAVWIKRVVDAAGDGYTANAFTLSFESS